MDTINEGRFEDTNPELFEKKNVDFIITEWNDKNHINIAHDIMENYFNWTKPTVQMLKIHIGMMAIRHLI